MFEGKVIVEYNHIGKKLNIFIKDSIVRGPSKEKITDTVSTSDLPISVSPTEEIVSEIVPTLITVQIPTTVPLLTSPSLNPSLPAPLNQLRTVP